MFGIQNYCSFLAAILVFQSVPGPGTIAILSATARNGILGGMNAVFGTITGDFLYMTAAVAGIATIMRANGFLLEWLQILGSLYLCYIGIRLVISQRRNDARLNCEISRWASFRRAFAVSLTNPKVVLFFVAFFPLFIQPNTSGLTLAIMMLHVTFLSLLYQLALVFAGNAIASRLKSVPFAQKLATRLAGIALIGFGLKLAANRR